MSHELPRVTNQEDTAVFFLPCLLHMQRLSVEIAV